MKHEKYKIKIVEKDIKKISKGDLILIGDYFHIVFDLGVTFIHKHYYINTKYYDRFCYSSARNIYSMKIYEHQMKKIKVVTIEEVKNG